jgi:hypothetical protein
MLPNCVTDTIPAQLSYEHYEKWRAEYLRLHPKSAKQTLSKLETWFARLRNCTDLRDPDLVVKQLMAYKTKNAYSFYFDLLNNSQRILRFFTKDPLDPVLVKLKQHMATARAAYSEAYRNTPEDVEKAREQVNAIIAAS